MLDAPQLQDDFYLNLVDWSPQNVLAVGLGSCVYLWSACTSKVGSLMLFGCCVHLIAYREGGQSSSSGSVPVSSRACWPWSAAGVAASQLACADGWMDSHVL